MEEINALFGGFAVAMSPFNIMLMLIGVILGVIIGIARRLVPCAGFHEHMALTRFLITSSVLRRVRSIYKPHLAVNSTCGDACGCGSG